MFARLCKLCKCHSTCKHVQRLSSVGLATGTELNLWTIVILITRAIASPRRCLANSLRHPQVLGTKSSGLGTHRFRTASSRNAGDARQRNGDLWQARVAPGPVWRCDESERRVELNAFGPCQWLEWVRFHPFAKVSVRPFPVLRAVRGICQNQAFLPMSCWPRRRTPTRRLDGRR